MTNRFIKHTIRTSNVTTTQMPWARGARRAAFVAKRMAPIQRKSA